MTAHELFGAIPSSVAIDILEFVFANEKPLYRAALQAVAEARKVRPVYLERQPRLERHPLMITVLSRAPLEPVSDNLLRTWLLKKHPALLKDFLDALKISHKDGVVENLPESMDEPALRAAIEQLLAKHPAELVAVYLHAFNHMNESKWTVLEELLPSEPRLHLKRESEGAHTHNRRAWDERARRSEAYAQPASDADFQHPLAVIDECGWLGGSVVGKRVLCLAAGGGRHGPLFAAAGAQVTVADISARMLALDRQVAADRGLPISTVETSMDDLSLLPTGFEIVIQPVSTCYLPDVGAVYREVARIMAAGGLYVSQHKQPVSLQTDAQPSGPGYCLSQPYYRTGPLPPAPDGLLHREADAIEFLHRWEDLVGGLCRSGFVIEDLIEPRHAKPDAGPGSFGHRSNYVPPFVTIKARRINPMNPPPSRSLLWTP